MARERVFEEAQILLLRALFLTHMSLAMIGVKGGQVILVGLTNG